MRSWDEVMDEVAEAELQRSIRPEDHFARVDPTKTYPYSEILRWKGIEVWYCGRDGACMHTTRDYAVEHKAEYDRRMALPELVRVTVTYDYMPNFADYPEGTRTAYAAKEVDKEQSPDVEDVLEIIQTAAENGEKLTVEWSTVDRWNKNR